MSAKDKLIQKILEEKDIIYEEAKKVLLGLGYTENAPASGSSHYTFRKNAHEKITLVKTQKPLKRYLVKKIKEAILND